MTLMLLLELKHTFAYLLAPFGLKIFLMLTLSRITIRSFPWSCMVLTYLFVVTILALPKCVALSNIYSGIFGNVLNATIFTSLGTKFVQDLT